MFFRTSCQLDPRTFSLTAMLQPLLAECVLAVVPATVLVNPIALPAILGLLLGALGVHFAHAPSALALAENDGARAVEVEARRAVALDIIHRMARTRSSVVGARFWRELLRRHGRGGVRSGRQPVASTVLLLLGALHRAKLAVVAPVVGVTGGRVRARARNMIGVARAR